MKRPFGSAVLDCAARLLTPYILLFALYVLFHGHHSPGGGFQGGTILAGALILIRLVRGRRAGWGVDRRQALILAASGVLIYAAVGIVCLASGGNYLDYSFLPFPLPAPRLRWLGILGIEIGVTIGVMGTMVLIFDLLTDRRRDEYG
ncbi:MAG: MnhB domain-containing protein [Elusimicrobiota bacterium]